MRNRLLLGDSLQARICSRACIGAQWLCNQVPPVQPHLGFLSLQGPLPWICRLEPAQLGIVATAGVASQKSLPGKRLGICGLLLQARRNLTTAVHAIPQQV